MESPSAKRRKTSPSTSLGVDASNTQIRSPSRGSDPSTPFRASYLSPTKASLARFHPNLLPSSTTAATKRPSSRGSQGPDLSRSSAVDGAQSLIGGIHTITRPVTPSRETTPPVPDSTGGVNGGSPVRNIQSVSGGLSAAPRRRSRTPGRYASPSKRVPYEPRASPPQAATESDPAQGTANELVEQDQTPHLAVEPEFTAEGGGPRPGVVREEDFELPTIPRPLGNNVNPGIRRDVDAEPRLPSTPTQLGLEPPPEPPNGLLLSSPSKRPKRRTRTSAKSSPLKPRTSATTETAVDSQEQSRLGPRTYYSHIQQATPNNEDTNSNTSQHTKPESLAQRLSLFLPFSKRPAPPVPRPPTPPLVVLDALPDPLHFALDTVTATEDSVESPPSDNPHLRRKEITFTSPQKLLVVKVQVTVNLTTRKTTDITLSSINPWAASDLGTWLRKPFDGRDLAAVRDAIDRYWKLSEIRAKFWFQCEQKFGNLLTDSASLDIHDTTKSKNTTSNRPKGHRKPTDPTDPSTPSPPSPPLTNPPPPTPHQPLHHHFGRSSLLLSQPPISLLISWRLAFDATGKLESHISAHAAFPNSWLQAEGGGELARVGEAFDGLLRGGKGVFEAVEVVMGVVFRV